MTRLLPVLVAIVSLPTLLTLAACACGPTGETDRDLAPLVFTPTMTSIEVPATIRIRDGRPEVEARIPNCTGSALSGATVQILDAAGAPLGTTGVTACARRISVTGAAGTSIDLRVVVTLPAAAAATGEIELVTFQDVCASVGASEIVSFGI